MTIEEEFRTNRYILIKDVLDPADCQRLVERLFRLHQEGSTVRDDQCPRSSAVYGDTELDRLLAEMTTPLGGALGLKLLPTYSYARLYFTGEVLARHVDRPACEISATMTLGFDAGSVWPIHFARDRRDFFGTPLNIGVGSLAAYRGCELIHWREAFTGKWQAQVFLHYVDANGPHAGEYLDGRTALGAPKDGPMLRNDSNRT